MKIRYPKISTGRAGFTFSILLITLGLSACEIEDWCWPIETSLCKSDTSTGASSSASTDTSSSASTDANSSSPSGGTQVTDVRSSLSLPTLAPTGTVWKPISEGDHKLVVLTPASWPAYTATIRNTDGSLVDSGTACRRTNGNRCTYRFSRPGGGYPDPCVLRLGTTDYLINNPAQRIN